MASRSSLKIIVGVSVVSYKLGVLPFYFILEQDGGGGGASLANGTKLQRFIWRIFCTGQILATVLGYLATGLWYDRTHADLTIESRVQFYFIAAAVSVSTFIQLWTLFKVDSTLHVFATYFQLQSKTSKILHVNPEESDGCEVYLKLFLLVIFGVPLLAVPIISTFIHTEMHVFGLLKTNYLLATFIFGTIFGCSIFVDWLYLFSYAGITFVYVSWTCRSLKLMMWEQGMANSRSHEFIQLYKILQLMNGLVNLELKHTIGIVVALACGVIICGLDAIIGHYSKISNIVILAASSTTSIAIILLAVICKKGAELRNVSKKFRNSYLKNHLTLSKLQVKNLYGTRELIFSFSSVVIVRNKTYPYLMSDFVLARVVDYLLVSKSYVHM